MKTIFTSIASILIALNGFAQNPSVVLNPSAACVGDQVSATVHPPELSLTASGTLVNSQNGVMFDIIGTESATIKDFVISPQDPGEIEVYYKTGSFVGSEGQSNDWNLLGTTTVNAGTDVPLDMDLDVDILPGQTLGFYITLTGASEFIYYENGTAVGNALVSDAVLQINEGIGLEYPFGTTYSPRNFIGEIVYEPVLADIEWSVGAGTDTTIDFTATESMAVGVTSTYAGGVHEGFALLPVTDVDVAVTADPAVLGWDESSNLTSTVIATQGLVTTFEAGNSQSGAMFDIEAESDLSIQGFSVTVMEGSGIADIEVFYKTGTFVGSEESSASWTSLGTYSDVDPGKSVFLELPNALDMVSGQTFGIYITRTDGGYLRYSNSSNSVGTEFVSNGIMNVKVGTGVQYPLNVVNYPERMLNCIVHHSAETSSGTTYSWSPEGGTGGSAMVSPNQDVTYTLTATVNGCDGQGSADVSMTVGVEEVLENMFKVYPNPATDVVTISANEPVDVRSINVFDMSGKVVYSSAPNRTVSSMELPVSSLAEGMYGVQLSMDEGVANFRFMVQK